MAFVDEAKYQKWLRGVKAAVVYRPARTTALVGPATWDEVVHYWKKFAAACARDVFNTRGGMDKVGDMRRDLAARFPEMYKVAGDESEWAAPRPTVPAVAAIAPDAPPPRRMRDD